VEQEPERPNITGTWEGIEATVLFPFSWRFTITDNNGTLSGTYQVREDFDWGDASGTITGTHTETGKVTIQLDLVHFMLVSATFSSVYAGIRVGFRGARDMRGGLEGC
jgi:hypothetical protein